MCSSRLLYSNRYVAVLDCNFCVNGISTILQVLKVLLTAVASTKFRGTLQWPGRIFCCIFIPYDGIILLNVFDVLIAIITKEITVTKISK